MNFIEKTVDYFRSAKSEMFKVSWPSRRDTLRYSALIIGISVVVAIFFASLDYGFTNLFDWAVTHAPRNNAAVQVQSETQVPVVPVNPTTDQTAPQTPTTQDINLQDAKPIETPKK
ncbi:MAG: preprotein translocase subunit SecE [Patescibacteria group bacterium]